MDDGRRLTYLVETVYRLSSNCQRYSPCLGTTGAIIVLIRYSTWDLVSGRDSEGAAWLPYNFMHLALHTTAGCCHLPLSGIVDRDTSRLASDSHTHPANQTGKILSFFTSPRNRAADMRSVPKARESVEYGQVERVNCQ